MRFMVIIMAVSLLTIFSNCDPNEVELPAWRSEYIFPIVDAGFDINDVALTESLLLEEDSTGALTVIYVGERDSVSLLDFLEIPDQAFGFDLPRLPNSLPDIAFSEEVSAEDLELAFGADIDVPPFSIAELSYSVDISENFEQATFESGEVAISITNGFPFSISAGLELSIVNADGQVVLSHTTTNDIAQGATYTVIPPLDLTSKTLSGEFSIRLTDIASDGATSVSIENDDAVRLDFSVNNLVLKSATLSLSAFESEEFSEVLSFDLPFNARLQRVVITSGLFTGNVNSELNFPLSLNYSFPTITQNGQPLSGSFEFASQNINIDLANADIDLTNGVNTASNTLPVVVSISSVGSTTPVTINFDEAISAQLQLKELRPHAVFGYLGYYEQLLEGDLEVDFFDRVVEGKISLNKPKVIARIDNELGLGVGLIDNENLFVRGENERLFPGETVDMNQSLKNVKIAAATNPGGVQRSEVILDGASEPSFVEFISLLPSDVSYSFPVGIGSTQIDLNQFAVDTSSVFGNIEIELPLDLTAENFTITDTLETALQFDTEYAEFISGFLNTGVTNFFPLEFTLQNYFLDSNYQVVDSLFVERRVIAPGTIGENGRVSNPFRVKFSVDVGKDKLDNLQKTAYSKPVFILNTTSQNRVKIFSDTQIFFKLNGDFKVLFPNQ